MSAHENPPQRPTAADALLAEQGPSPAGRAALREVLVAAQAPAARHELRGESAALAAYRTARVDYPAVPAAAARTRPGRRRLAAVISVKAAAALVAVTGMGGVALAASTGALPGPIDGPKPKVDKVRQVDDVAADSSSAPEREDAAAQRRAAASAASAEQADKKIDALRAGSDAKAVAALGRMCHAYDKGGFATKTRAEQSRAFRVLLRAAGGPGSVSEFCATVAAAGALDAARTKDRQAGAEARVAERQQRVEGKQELAEERGSDRSPDTGRPDTGTDSGSEIAQGPQRQGVGAGSEPGDRPRGNSGDD